MCCSDYHACIFAAVWSIVQTIIHVSWCIWGKYLYECEYTLDNSTFKYFWYLTYFYTNSCVNATLDHVFPNYRPKVVFLDVLDPFLSSKTEALDTYYPSELGVVTSFGNGNKTTLKFPAQSAVAERTYNIFYTYIIIDSLWIIAAVALLIGTLFRIRENLATILFFPWTIILLFILCFDGICTSWYGIDISYTYGIINWFLFIGGHNQTGLEEIEATFPKPVSTRPSILMMVLFSRFFVVWFVNLFLFFRVVQASLNVIEECDGEECLESKQFDQGYNTKMNLANNRRPRKFQVQDIDINTASTRIRRWQLYYGSDDEDGNDEVIRRHSRRNSKWKHQKRDENEDGRSVPNLSVIWGYEGDRSTSPSPLPDSGKQILNAFERQFLPANSIYSTANEQNASSMSVYSNCTEVNKRQRTYLVTRTNT